MTEENDFIKFKKIARLSREVIVTEKIDGTNAQIYIDEEGNIHVGSRTRWITPQDDNHGFAKWVYEHADELKDGLGPGRHFGEWWGSGINRGYGLPKGEKRFSLFNTIRWCSYNEEPQQIITDDPRIVEFQKKLPECCYLVPVLWRGLFDTKEIDATLIALEVVGSQAAPGYRNPEGIVIYHTKGNVMFKKTIDGDGHKRDRKKKGPNESHSLTDRRTEEGEEQS